MRLYFEPIDMTIWNVFHQNKGCKESFYATKDMVKGDILLLYVSLNGKPIGGPGVYACCEVISDVYFENDRRKVDAEIIKVSKVKPIISYDVMKKYHTQFRTRSKIADDMQDDVLKLLISG